MVTSIQIHENVKQELDMLKESDKESYEDVISKLIEIADKQKRKQKKLLIEGCKEMAKDSLKMVEEFRYADAEIDWKWKEN